MMDQQAEREEILYLIQFIDILGSDAAIMRSLRLALLSFLLKILLAQVLLQISIVAPGQAGKFRRRRGVEQGKQYIFNINNQIMLNTPNLINQGQNQALQNALLNDMNQYQHQNKQHLREPILNDLNNYQRNNK